MLNVRRNGGKKRAKAIVKMRGNKDMGRSGPQPDDTGTQSQAV